MLSKNLEERIAALEKKTRKIKKMEREIQRLQAIDEIQNLMGRYAYLHTLNDHEAIVEMYSDKAPDVFVNIGVRGHWVGEGKETARRAWGTFIDAPNPPGLMSLHPLVNPVIVVAGDGKTAKGTWIGIGMAAKKDETTGEPVCHWEWDKYGVDFIKEDGRWKFWHFHIYRIFSIGWNSDWSEISKMVEKPTINPNYTNYNKPDGPPIDSNPYSLSAVKQQLNPKPPETYKTWDETFSYGKPIP